MALGNARVLKWMAKFVFGFTIYTTLMIPFPFLDFADGWTLKQNINSAKHTRRKKSLCMDIVHW